MQDHAFGEEQPKAQNRYMMEGRILGTTEEEGNFGYIMNSKLMSGLHCKKGGATVTTVLGQLS